MDDGSTDDTARVADELAQTNPQEVRAVHQSNTGPGLAREAGRQVVHGEFIQYLDSDDLLLPEKFEKQVAGLRAHPECGVSYGKTRYRHADGQVEALAWKGTGAKVETMFPAFLVSRWWDTPTPLYRTSLCDEAGPWTDLRLEEDWEYDCRVASLGVRLHYCDEFIVEVRDHDDHRLCKGDALGAERMRERASGAHAESSHSPRPQGGAQGGLSGGGAFRARVFLLYRHAELPVSLNESQGLCELAREPLVSARQGMGFQVVCFF